MGRRSRHRRPKATERRVEDMLLAAVELHRRRDMGRAETLYRRVLKAAPAHPDALHFLGVLRHAVGQSDEGVALVERAIGLVPDFAGFHNNLGNIHAERGDVPAATAAYERSIALAPAAADPHNNLGALYQAAGRLEEAEARFQRAIELDPGHANAHNNLGLLCQARNDIRGAVRNFSNAITLAPRASDGRKLLATAYCRLGRIEDAAGVYREWLQEDPGNPEALHMLAACSAATVPGRASDAFLEATFDSFARSFEKQLMEHLHYRAPQLCGAMLEQYLPPPARQFALLDAGCGTGLCGPLMAPWAASLTGVDLSSGMLDRARNKGVYDVLEKAELTAFLERSCERWDVVLSADTLVYFGDLEPALAAARGGLRPDGLLVFTVEACADEANRPWELLPHGRYAHTPSYVEAVLASAGLALLGIAREVLRFEAGDPVNGWVVTARKRGPAFH